jgi:hypothetical protein
MKTRRKQRKVYKPVNPKKRKYYCYGGCGRLVAEKGLSCGCTY